MIRVAFMLAAVSMLLSAVGIGQGINPGHGQFPGAANSGSLQVRVVQPNGMPADQTQFQVELTSGLGVPIKTSFTDTEGRVSFDGLAAGNYTLKVTSPETDEATATVNLSGFEAIHVEDVVVQRPASAEESAPSAGSVSVQALSVPEKSRKEFNRGNEALHHQDLDAARHHYELALEGDAHYAAAANNLGTVCLRQRDFACARQSFEQAVAADAHSPQALANLGHLRMMEQSYPAAEELLLRSLAVGPNDPDSLLLMAQTELALHKFPDALWYAHKVADRNARGYEAAHVIAGQALEAIGRPAEAVAEYERFLRDAPDHPAAEQVEHALARLSQPAGADQRR